MRRDNITINTVPDWKLSYSAELVGEYLANFYGTARGFQKDELIKMKPGMMIIPPPEPSLNDFLMWNYKKTSELEGKV
jgi:hypothetical protein